MKKTIAVALATCAAMQLSAALPRTSGGRVVRGAKAVQQAPAEPEEQGGAVKIDQFPKLGRAATLVAPSVSGASSLTGKCYTKARHWIVLEAKYKTEAKCQESLTVTWHVILDTKTATVNKGNADGLAPYSYFTTSTTYLNIPKGAHAASVCLHPSYFERYGEPRAVGLVITDSKGETLAVDSDSMITEIKPHTKFWEQDNVMNAKQSNGEPYVERREGLQDRSKTIWAMVNPDDYELVAQ